MRKDSAANFNNIWYEMDAADHWHALIQVKDGLDLPIAVFTSCGVMGIFQSAPQYSSNGRYSYYNCILVPITQSYSFFQNLAC